MKILLFSPPSELPFKDANYIYPLGLCYLGAVLEKEGFEIKVFDFFEEMWGHVEKKIHSIIVSEKPDVVGISSLSMNRASSFKLSKMIKSINPEIKVIMGGVHSSVMHKQILENFPVDFVVLGEGEITVVELMKAIKENNPLKDFKKIKGIAFKYKNEVVTTNPRPFIKDLDSIPFLKHSYFTDKIKELKKACMITSRGCPFGCLFCSTSCHWGRMRRERSVDNIIKEIKYILKKFPEVEEIFFADDEFTFDQEHTIRFCKQLTAEGIKIRWGCSTRVSSVSKELAYWMKKAGCVYVGLGVESGSQALIDKVNKKITVEQAVNAFKIFHEAGIKTGIYLIVGIPGENSKTIEETIRLLKRISKSKADLKKPALLQIYPGTPLYQLAKQQRVISDDYWLTDKLAPFYTHEHSKNKLLFWSIKIALYDKLYKRELLKFLFKALTNPFKTIKILKLGK